MNCLVHFLVVNIALYYSHSSTSAFCKIKSRNVHLKTGDKKNLLASTSYSSHLSFTFAGVAECVDPHLFGTFKSQLEFSLRQNWEYWGVIPLHAPKFLKLAHRCLLVNGTEVRKNWQTSTRDVHIERNSEMTWACGCFRMWRRWVQGSHSVEDPG